ncbi:hypothetical protein AXG93_1224s1000 [Marchantia polymorpha subsp. ruderalis]|uniref:CENP-V/GFA domain-containing protein n=1 Tax=Marchantia polymorpha subsp. ruderalis TaxID=1480154 RepID=A0A176VG26_MARPO|nr:hypothetical protein AXG93_1224s1000 [Marchantia polymorpha subsp. ruderalis]
MWSLYHFCPDCGSTVYYENEDTPGVYAVPVGAFADPTFPAPQRSIYENRMRRGVVSGGCSTSGMREKLAASMQHQEKRITQALLAGPL